MKGYTNALGPITNSVLNSSLVSGSFAIDGAASANGTLAIAIGNQASANGNNGIAIGKNANASQTNSIQIGTGSNNEANTFKVGFENGENYTILDGTTGLIPDGRISSAIARSSDIGEANTRLDGIDSSISEIENKIPNQASSSNQLADKDFVNSTVATNTAVFRGTYNSVEELEAYSGEKTNNDYAFVRSIDSSGNTIYTRYKYNGTDWVYEYELNNSSFTAEQWAAINSGATTTIVAQVATNASNISTLQSTSATKQELADAVASIGGDTDTITADLNQAEADIDTLENIIGDAALQTEAQTLTGAINEVKNIADTGVTRSDTIKTWSDTVTARVNELIICNGSVQITTNWNSNQDSATNSNYPYIFTFVAPCQIKFTTENDFDVSIAFAPAQVMTNNYASFCSFEASANGNATNCAITIYAKEIPSASFTAKYSITRGNLSGTVNNLVY